MAKLAIGLEPIRKISWEPEAMHEMSPIIDIKTQFSEQKVAILVNVKIVAARSTPRK